MMSEPAPTSPHIAVVAPTYNNGGTVRGVLDSLESLGFEIIVVDDGSRDATQNVLADWHAARPNQVLLRHEINRGKAAAMLTGFAAARSAGFTHALTIDTDSQHDPADAVRLRAACVDDPLAMIVGSRPCDRGYPLKSRIGRSISNALVALISGAEVTDSQCGLRVYPLEVIELLKVKADRYAFETEVLIRAAWANVAIVEVPIRCIYQLAGGRITHFRVLRDSIAAVAMHLRLLAISHVPWPARRLRPVVGDAPAPGTIFDRARRWLNPLRAWRQLRHDARERERLGASIGWGLFVGTQLPLGYKGALCLLLAKVFRLQPLVVLATSSLSTPPLGFILWGAAIVCGHVLLHGAWPSPERYNFVGLGPSALGALVRLVAIEWVVGGIVFGAALGLSACLLTTILVRLFGRRPPGEAAVLSTRT